MRTKQEVIDFLESKVGGVVECKGNPSLNSQCVTLIKSLMEFLGVPDPYKARGHAKTVINSYLNEGIAKAGIGNLSVYSNKDMGGGYGHIWLSIDGTFYESNGVKSLTVTKGKTYSYDMVCNFDSYISPEVSKELAECELHKSNLQNQVNGLLKDIEAQKGVISDTETKLGTANGRIQELTKQNENLSTELGAKTSALLVAEQSAKTAKEALQKELGDQLDYADKWEDEKDAHNITKKVLSDALWDYEDELKLSHPGEDASSRIASVKTALVNLTSSTNLLNNKINAIETENKKLGVYKKGIDKMTISQCIILLIDKIKEKYGKNK